MNRYSYSSSRRSRRKKWVYFISALFIILAMRITIHGLKPAPVIGNEDEFNISITGIQTENDAALYAEKSIPEPELHEIHASASESDPELKTFIDEVMTRIDAKPSQIIDTRNKLNKLLSTPMSRQELALVKKQLSKLSEQWLFSRSIFPEDNLCSSYNVEPGDQFIVLGKKFKIPYETLMQINNISNPKSLRAGETIKIINGPFHCKIYLSTFTMDLYLQDTFVRSFPVGLGKAGMETPTGRWMVKAGGKLISPVWTDPIVGKTYNADDPDYPLGSRWIGLEGIDGAAKNRTGFAIHGTKNPKDIGTAQSRGCIRLCDDDAILVYNLLTPCISQVIVVE